jgi:hypothetical protein
MENDDGTNRDEHHDQERSESRDESRDPEQQEKTNKGKKASTANRDIGFLTRLKLSWKGTSNWNKLLVALTCVIAVANSCYTHYAHQQFKVMHGQLDQIILQYPELQKSANAAKSAADVAQQTMRIDQRAWIRFGLVNNQLTLGQPIDAPVMIGVAGKTPARKVTGDMKAELLRPDQAPDFVYAKGHPHFHLPTVLILPNTDMHLTLTVLRAAPRKKEPDLVLFDSAIQHSIDQGDLLIVVHGMLTYEDVFGVEHWLKFCTFGSGNLRHRGSPKCDEYNDTDNNK